VAVQGVATVSLRYRSVDQYAETQVWFGTSVGKRLGRDRCLDRDGDLCLQPVAKNVTADDSQRLLPLRNPISLRCDTEKSS
jgi:hypothetical protein